MNLIRTKISTLPKKEDNYFVILKNGTKSVAYFNGKRFEVAEYTEIIYWYRNFNLAI